MDYNSPQVRAKTAAQALAFTRDQHRWLMLSLASFRRQNISDTERLRLLNLHTRAGRSPIGWSRPSLNRSTVRWARGVAA